MMQIHSKKKKKKLILPLTFRSIHETERDDGLDDSEHLHAEQGVHLPRVRVGLEDLQRFAARHGDLLRLRAGEVAVDGMRDAAAPLQGEVVQMHDRRRTGQRRAGGLANDFKDNERWPSIENRQLSVTIVRFQ